MELNIKPNRKTSPEANKFRHNHKELTQLPSPVEAHIMLQFMAKVSTDNQSQFTHSLRLHLTAIMLQFMMDTPKAETHKLILRDNKDKELTHKDKDSKELTHKDKDNRELTHKDKDNRAPTHKDRDNRELTHKDKANKAPTHKDKAKELTHNSLSEVLRSDLELLDQLDSLNLDKLVSDSQDSVSQVSDLEVN
jgi:hypothetical protein